MWLGEMWLTGDRMSSVEKWSKEWVFCDRIRASLVEKLQVIATDVVRGVRAWRLVAMQRVKVAWLATIIAFTCAHRVNSTCDMSGATLNFLDSSLRAVFEKSQRNIHTSMISLWKKSTFFCSQLNVIAHSLRRYTWYVRGKQPLFLTYMGTYQRTVQRDIRGNSVVTHHVFVPMPDNISTTRHGDAYNMSVVTKYVRIPMAKGITIGK